MIQISNVDVAGWEAAIRGMRNPMNSWARSDSMFVDGPDGYHDIFGEGHMAEISGNVGNGDLIGPYDHKLMMWLADGGPVHAKYRRMIVVYADILAPLYWWKEFDTYKVGTVANSCSTMHKIQAKEFTVEDFSCEHLMEDVIKDSDEEQYNYFFCGTDQQFRASYKTALDIIIDVLNHARRMYLKTNDKRYWWQMIQLLPSSYNQLRTVMLNYEVLHHMYYSPRWNHKLDEWREFCQWIKTLPYSEIIVGESLSEA